MNSKSCLRAGAVMLVTFALFLTGTINLDSVPPLWWDEGWLLTIARNWLEQGHYGRFFAETLEPISPTNGFPVIAPAALSFHLLGIGLWQGRVVGVLFTLGALALTYHLAFQLYDRSVAVGTLVVLLLLSGHRELHPVIMGRQVLGEMPAMFYLLAGYACFLSALRRSIWLTTLAIVFWSAALITKLQVLPFWVVSILIPLSMALFRGNFKLGSLLMAALVGALTISQLLLQLLQFLLNAQTLATSQIARQFDVTVWVPFHLVPRLVALILTLAFGLPTLFGLYYAASKLMRDSNELRLETPQGVVRLALLVLAGGWFAWYVFFSVGWLRYLFPATFIGSIFVAALLHRLTNGFSLSSTIQRGSHSLRRLRLNRESAGALFATLLIAWTSSITVLELYRSFVLDADRSALLVADFINNKTPSNALIETYDSELFFLLNRRYHYPPDQIHVELNRRTFLGRDVPIDYNPLAANPDYLVLGPQSKLWRLYEPVLDTGAFRLLRSYSRYDVYQRVR